METAFERVMSLGPMPNLYAAIMAEARVRSGRVEGGFQLIEQTLLGLKEPEIGCFYLPKLLSLREECLACMPKGSAGEVSAPPAAAMRLLQHNQDQLAALKAAAAAVPSA